MVGGGQRGGSRKRGEAAVRADRIYLGGSSSDAWRQDVAIPVLDGLRVGYEAAAQISPHFSSPFDV